PSYLFTTLPFLLPSLYSLSIFSVTNVPQSPIFFFYSYGHPPDLHSFPTRRSSDLVLRCGRSRARHDRYARKQRGHRPAWSSARRSEEHTSELQSHLNLVCRLLLEKKKKYSEEP